MTTTVEQVPGNMPFRWCRQDDFSKLLTFSIALTGYTFTAALIRSDTGASVTLTVTNTDLSAGKITLSCDKTLLSVVPLGIHNWYLDGVVGGVDRRQLAGTFELIDYPS